MTSELRTINDTGSRPAPIEAESLVAMGEKALHVDGDLTAARSWFNQSYVLAEEAGQTRLMAAAALGLGGLWVHEHRLVADAARVEARQRTALSLLDARSSMALRMRARLAAEADYRAGHCATIMPIVEEARQAGDPVALAEALSLAHHCLLGPEHVDLRLTFAEELLREGSRTCRPGDVVMGLLWRTVDLFMLGHPHAERSFAELSGFGTMGRHAAAGFVVSALRVMLTIRSGRLADAERFAQECAERGRVAGDADHVGWYGVHMVTIRWYQGRIGELVGTLAEVVNSPTLGAVDNEFLAGLAVAAATAGDKRQARGALARICGDVGERSQSSSWLAAMHGVVEAAALLGDAETAERAYAMLLPYARLPMMASLGVACFGSAHHALGVASLATGEVSRAVGHFRSAIRRNMALGHWPATTLSRHRLGQALTLLGELRSAEAELSAAAAEAASLGMVLPTLAGVGIAPGGEHRPTGTRVCTRSGRQWRIELGERSAVVDDSVGVRYLVTLLGNPGVEVPATDLAAQHGSRGINGADRPPDAAAHAVLDEAALRQYRARLRELCDDIDEAEAMHDSERVARLRADADWLADELQAATGLGGRARHFTDDAERARIAVGKAIRRALQRISAADDVIGADLCSAIRTGRSCCYRPTHPPAVRPGRSVTDPC